MLAWIGEDEEPRYGPRTAAEFERAVKAYFAVYNPALNTSENLAAVLCAVPVLDFVLCTAPCATPR